MLNRSATPPNLMRSITRNYQMIESMRPTIGTDGMSDPQREAIQMLTWMSWQQIGAMPEELQEALPELARQGLVELNSITAGTTPTMVRLTVAPRKAEGASS